MPKLAGKVALVTGASKGIGAGIAKEMASAGASVVVNYATDRKGADAVVDTITKANGQAIAVQADVSRSSDVRRMLDEANSAYGVIDILVNNAGVYMSMPLEAMTEEEFHREFNINVLGPLLTIRESLRYFGPSGGSVINIGSAASLMHPPHYSVYAASKGALDAITGVLAKELATKKIRVNSINPGATRSEGAFSAGLYGVESEFERQLVAMTPLGRVGEPSDIAKVAVFLASDDAGWLTGEHIIASGGLR